MFGVVSAGSSGAPRFWATIWSDVLEPSVNQRRIFHAGSQAQSIMVH
jgi:hypothetical protein